MGPNRVLHSADDKPAVLGRALVAQLFILLKTASNYGEGHAAIDAPAANVLRVVGDIEQENENATLKLKGSHLYLGADRLRADAAGYEASRLVMEAMRRHMVGRISFSPGLTEAELASFAYALLEADEGEAGDPYARVLQRMQRRKITAVEVEMLPEEEESVEIDRDRLKDDKLEAKLFYRRMVLAMDDVISNVAAGQPLKLRECKRLVQHVIDLLPTREGTLLGLTTQRSTEFRSERHAANVCILSLAMGRRLGISKFHLSELGMAALFHDIGKAGMPHEIPAQQGALTDEERRLVEAHPVYGVREILRLKGIDAMTSTIITGIFEHHLLADHSGYPRLPYKKLSLFGRIIGIADAYDGLTSPQGAAKKPLPPEKALRFMLTRGGKEYDLPLLKLLVKSLGIYPVGSLVLLESREIAVVVEKSADPAQLDHPQVKVIADATGREINGGIVDLGVGEQRPRIVAPLDPAPFRIDVSRYFA
jgi:HD-GYP domain-containing protein (c-di-GMP phosphodiesterase class II)